MNSKWHLLGILYVVNSPPETIALERLKAPRDHPMEGPKIIGVIRDWSLPLKSQLKLVCERL